MNEMDRLLSNARIAQEERRRAEHTLNVAREREKLAVIELEKATKALTDGLPTDVLVENITLSGDSH